jgi:hypothetical protein
LLLREKAGNEAAALLEKDVRRGLNEDNVVVPPELLGSEEPELKSGPFKPYSS